MSSLFDKQNKSTKWLWIGGLIVGIIISYLTVVAFEATSDVAFCSSCHAMEPVVASHLEDVHGGNNSYGVKARCVDCHLPHDSVLSHVVMKGVTGFKDLALNITFNGEDRSERDWILHLADRKDFVYDDGCMGCHQNLTDNPKMDAFKTDIHKEYFAKRDKNPNFRCVNCHNHVGHKDLARKAFVFFKKN